ncbi:hypothetical protein [Deinococcus sp. UYEF24]
MKFNVSTWATQRKKVRSSFNWGQVKRLLSLSDNIRGPHLKSRTGWTSPSLTAWNSPLDTG